MYFPRNKKGMQLAAIISIILLVIAVGAIIGVYNTAFMHADDKVVENTCRGTNALRFGTDIDVGIDNVHIIPRGCKTIDKTEDLPSKGYEQKYPSKKEAAMAELRDLTARCWWMWLEGRQQNMFEQELWEGNKCFICYSFSVEDDAEFSYNELVSSLAQSPYTARDDSDSCAGGGGGTCEEECGQDLPRAVPSKVCGQGKKCCVAQSPQDECVNKGGQCSSSPPGGSKLYTAWSCANRGEQCYVSDENYASYFDYIYGVQGLSGGKGIVLLDDDSGSFTSQKKYAVTFMSPDKHATLWTWVGFVATGVVAAVVTVGTGGLGTPAIIVLAGGVAGTALTSAEPSEYNYLYLSDFDTVETECVVEGGAAA